MSERVSMRCDEHGIVMKVKVTLSRGLDASAHWFCPYCQRELSDDSPLTEIERQGQPAPTFDEWVEANSPIGVIDARLGDET